MTRRGFLTGLGALVAFPVVAPALKALSTALPAPFPVVPTRVMASFYGVPKFVTDEMCEDALLDVVALMREQMIQEIGYSLEDALFNGA